MTNPLHKTLQKIVVMLKKKFSNIKIQSCNLCSIFMLNVHHVELKINGEEQHLSS